MFHVPAGQDIIPVNLPPVPPPANLPEVQQDPLLDVVDTVVENVVDVPVNLPPLPPANLLEVQQATLEDVVDNIDNDDTDTETIPVNGDVETLDELVLPGDVSDNAPETVANNTMEETMEAEGEDSVNLTPRPETEDEDENETDY